MDHDQGGRDLLSLFALFVTLVMCLCMVGFGAEFFYSRILFNPSVSWVVVVGVLGLTATGLQLSATMLAELLLALGLRKQGHWITTKILRKRIY